MAVFRIKEIMAQKGISREELAVGANVSKTTISNINTETNMPTIHLLLKIAEVLDVDIRELFVPTKNEIVSQSDLIEARELIAKGLEILKSKN